MDHAQLVGYAEKRIEDCDDTGTPVAKDKAHEEYLREHVRPGRSSRSIFQEAMNVDDQIALRIAKSFGS
ncbi:hypothetical protein B0A48_10687 [Cryoendolithus antarcticus]|uniref:Uncharacterized protein n=1 Tax=Cryoendolithus antarcticus TaxID=1507870 RepID=A0A1V8SY89_9PEZI|nr:hypothetical protein B0A48_10687 [Cryoendolithus antarcticus]